MVAEPNRIGVEEAEVNDWRAKWTQDDQDFKIVALSKLTVKLFPELGTANQWHPRLSELAKSAYERTDLLFGAKEALAWAEGYVVPPALVESDERQLPRR